MQIPGARRSPFCCLRNQRLQEMLGSQEIFSCFMETDQGSRASSTSLRASKHVRAVASKIPLVAKAHPKMPFAAGVNGGMFWFRRKKFLGS